jgi:mannose-6-phosphate isomerase-like protein (cupin superfamily)
MNEKIIDKETAPHYTWGNNCSSWILVNTEGLSVKQEIMPLGTKEQLHFHNKAQQFFFILKGAATFYVNDEIIIVPEQKGLSIKPNTKHFIANETTEPLEFLLVSQPSTNEDRVAIV